MQAVAPSNRLTVWSLHGDYPLARIRMSPGVEVEANIIAGRRASRVAVLHRQHRPQWPPDEVAIDEILRDGLVAPASIKDLRDANPVNLSGLACWTEEHLSTCQL